MFFKKTHNEIAIFIFNSTDSLNIEPQDSTFLKKTIYSYTYNVITDDFTFTVNNYFLLLENEDSTLVKNIQDYNCAYCPKS